MSEVNSVYKKILAVASSGASKKTGKMTAVGKYNYHTIDGVLDHLRPLLVEQGLVITYSVSRCSEYWEGSQYDCSKEIEIRITDVETGHFIEGREVGFGIDRGDKGTGKASSYALKTWLVGTFMLKGLPDENTQPMGKADPVKTAPAPSSGTPGVFGDSIPADRVKSISAAIKALNIDKKKVLGFAGVDSIEKMSPKTADEVEKIIQQRREGLHKGSEG